MREPSSGGTGIRLNTASETLILATPAKNSTIYIAICETANNDIILTIKSDFILNQNMKALPLKFRALRDKIHQIFVQGVMMTHGNVLATVSAVMTIVPGLGSKDVYLAYLPLAHILEIVAEVCIFLGLDYKDYGLWQLGFDL